MNRVPQFPQLYDKDWLQDQSQIFTIKEIAEVVGCARNTVARVMEKYGIEKPISPAIQRTTDFHIGERFGKLIVVSESPRGTHNDTAVRVNVECDCGGSKIIRLSHLLRQKSGWDHCGCLTEERRKATMRQNNSQWWGDSTLGECNMGACSEPKHCKGLCAKHYADDLADKKPDCHIGGCDKPIKSVSRGLCAKHNRRFLTCGDPYFEYEWVGPKVDETVKGYRTIQVDDGRSIFEHRWIMEQYIGRPLLPHENIHHKNGVRDDNRIENLELWSTKQPYGQRVLDKLAWAREIIELYGHMSPEDC